MFIVAGCVSIAFLYVFPSVLASLQEILQHMNHFRTVHMNVLESDDYFNFS